MCPAGREPSIRSLWASGDSIPGPSTRSRGNPITRTRRFSGWTGRMRSGRRSRSPRSRMPRSERWSKLENIATRALSSGSLPRSLSGGTRSPKLTFRRVLPLEHFSVIDGKLTFEDLGARYDIEKGREYSVRWATCDDNGLLTPLPGGAGREVPALQSGSPYLAATIECQAHGAACGHAITVYLRARPTGPEVVGIDR